MKFGRVDRSKAGFLAIAVLAAVLAVLLAGCTDERQEQAESHPVEQQQEVVRSQSGRSATVAPLPEYLSGEGVIWIEQWPWIQTAGLCGEEVTSDFDELPKPGHGLTAMSQPTAALREAASMLGLEWEDWERRWFDRNGVTLYRRTAWQGDSREYAAASLYLVYHGDPPRWDEAQSSILYLCDEEAGDPADRPLPPAIHVDLDGEQVDVRYGAVLALLNSTHLPGVDLERSCSWFSPGFVDHRVGRRTAVPHGLSLGMAAVSDLPISLMHLAVMYGQKTPLNQFEHLWVTEHRVMAFTRVPRQKRGRARLAEVREFALFEDAGDRRWIELASGTVWNCSEVTPTPTPMLVEPPTEIPDEHGGIRLMLTRMYGRIDGFCVEDAVADFPEGWNLEHGLTADSAPPDELQDLLSRWEMSYGDYQYRWFDRFRIVLMYHAWVVTDIGSQGAIAFALDIRRGYDAEADREFWEAIETASVAPCDFFNEQYEIVFEPGNP
ncbi:MAG: hypothetical protein F4088_02345 [Chloroflexi bacterium]|nr:hypothetical protein [Chloroflexota bacterium]MYC01074.1 hypothetical protein [Chloroflexota bacterium]MYJ57739.1 hypothetical protein [Chloroflexota bacterium]